jgi:hypothetical protein
MSAEDKIRHDLGSLCRGHSKTKKLKEGGPTGKSFKKWATEEMAETAHKSKGARKKRFFGGSMGKNIGNMASGVLNAGKQFMNSDAGRAVGNAASDAGNAAMGIARNPMVKSVADRGLSMARDAVNSPAGRSVLNQGRALANRAGLGGVADAIGGAAGKFFKKGGSARHRNKCGR